MRRPGRAQTREQPGWRRWAVWLAPCWVLLVAGLARAQAPDAFERDLRELTRHPHRQAGSSAGQAAAAYLEQRLRQLGVSEVQPLDLPVWEPVTERCELVVGDRRLRLYPVRANLIALPVTPEQGVHGPLLYAGRGEYEDYGRRRVQGAIVVLDYASEIAWRRALALGASAVIWLGQGDETPFAPRHVPLPANQLRFYAAERELGGFDLRADQPEVSLYSRMRWQPRRGRDLVARVQGSDPTFASEQGRREALAVAAAYDTFGVVPELTPGARGAANVAALLELAADFARRPARRDLLLLFLDGQGRGGQGGRELYAALQQPAGESAALLREQQDQLAQIQGEKALLEREGLKWRRAASAPGDAPDAAVALERSLQELAGIARDDVRKELSVLRLSAPDASRRARLAALDLEWQRWDNIRRALHEGKLAELVSHWEAAAEVGAELAAQGYREQFARLLAAARQRFAARKTELEEESAISEQRQALRAAFGFTGDASSTWIALHLDLQLGGGGPQWGFVAGDATRWLFPWRTPRPEGDAPGYYGRLLNLIAASEPQRVAPNLEPSTLLDPLGGVAFASWLAASAGNAAGDHGIYHLAVMTGNDLRPREGQPADTVENLSWRRIQTQGREAGAVLRAFADRPDASLPRTFTPLAQSKYPRFTSGRPSGNYAALQVSGSLSEDRPAAGALLALWPGEIDWKRQAWNSLADADALPEYEPVAFERVNADGRFRLVGLRSDLYEEVMTIGGLFDAQGRVTAITNTEKQTQRLIDGMRVNLFFANGGSWTVLPASTVPAAPERLRLMKGSSDTAFPDNRSLWGMLGGSGFFYLSDQFVDVRVKLFHPSGSAALGEFSDAYPMGGGIEPRRFQQGINLQDQTAQDLWSLNERRLQTLRERGVTSADLEQLHARARTSLRQVTAAPSVAERHAAAARSAALSQRVYLPIRETMDDLVYAIVILLLLSIPFAFSLERLLIGASGVYGRILGFVAIFLVTFGALFALHPGFSIASTPLIIFLAFALMVLSSLVIYIVLRKFKAELLRMQGQAAGHHQLEISHIATLLAAIGMGMSTMRRRPARTLLSALTVVLLTFTLLSFASFSQEIGIRSRYEGPRNDQAPASLLLRGLDFGSLPRALVDTLQGEQGPAGLLAPHYWLVRTLAGAPRFRVARVDDGRSLDVDAVMGVSAAEAERWPALARALGNGDPQENVERLRNEEVFLPRLVSEVLQLVPGDRVLVRGRELTFAGAHDGPALQRLEQLDRQSVLPVDFISASEAQQAASTTTSGSSTLPTDVVERAFLHLGSEQVALAAPEVVRSIGGALYGISVHTDPALDAAEAGRRIAEATALPVWTATPTGVERLLLSRLTQLSGGLGLFVPLLLGGLILFGTLLGSISDREKEIYTFSALGLSPLHVGMLFFAEAGVYAFVGGVGGQLLAQAVGLAASLLSAAGVIAPLSLNYSSTHALFATAVVMLTVLVSAIYPAVRASRSANPGVARRWQLPEPVGDELSLTFPFTVSDYDISGVVSFLAEHFRRHDDAGLGSFAASNVAVVRNAAGQLELRADAALAPFDLGVTQSVSLSAVPSQIPGVDEVHVRLSRHSGSSADWQRANRTFLHELRRQFLVWRTLSHETVEAYRQATLQALGAPELTEHAVPGAAE